jgi:hypothetical protein
MMFVKPQLNAISITGRSFSKLSFGTGAALGRTFDALCGPELLTVKKTRSHPSKKGGPGQLQPDASSWSHPCSIRAVYRLPKMPPGSMEPSVIQRLSRTKKPRKARGLTGLGRKLAIVCLSRTCLQNFTNYGCTAGGALITEAAGAAALPAPAPALTGPLEGRGAGVVGISTVLLDPPQPPTRLSPRMMEARAALFFLV